MTAPGAHGTTRSGRSDARRNRERLLVAAGQLFDRMGLDAGVDEIARAAGVGMGTLYRHFSTKDSLIAALVDDIVRSILGLATAACADDDGGGLERFLEGASAVQAAHRGCLSRVWSQGGAASDSEELRRRIRELLAAAKRHGRVRDDLTETDVTMVLWSTRGVIETTGEVAPEAWRRHLSLLVAGMRAAGPPLVSPPLSTEDVWRIVGRS